MYECPIQKITSELRTQMIQQEEEQALLEVEKVIGFSVDKEELLKALRYNREQYQKGYVDGLKADKWIPVRERLPEEGQEILFSTKTGRVHSGKYYDDDSANQWYSQKDKCRAWNNVVSAWMPLPEPYKAESEDKE